MASNTASTPLSVAELAQTQNRHSKQLRKLEKARKRAEKASRKLNALETTIATHATSIHDAQLSRAPTSTAAARPLRDALLIFNPRAKAAQKQTCNPEELVECLRSYGIAADLRLKTSGKVARQLARDAAKRGVELVIVAGGDGTIEDVFPKLLGSKTALGIIPLGTMNNIARSLGIPLDVEHACLLVGMGIKRHIDVGRICSQSKPKGAYFLESAGVGLSALAAPLGQAAEKGQLQRFVASLGKMFTFQGAEVCVACDDNPPLEAHTQVVTVSNAPLLGKNMLVAPDAKADDGLFDVAVYDGLSKYELERHFLAIANGTRIDDPRVSFRRAQRVQISASAPLAANADLNVLDAEQRWALDVLPGALAVVVGKGIGLTFPVDAAPSVPPLSGPQEVLEVPQPEQTMETAAADAADKKAQ